MANTKAVDMPIIEQIMEKSKYSKPMKVIVLLKEVLLNLFQKL